MSTASATTRSGSPTSEPATAPSGRAASPHAGERRFTRPRPRGVLGLAFALALCARTARADELLSDTVPIQRFLSESAKRHSVWIVGGSIPLTANDPARLRNACLVFDSEGRQVAHYDKIHLFGFQRGEESYDESQCIEAGDKLTTFVFNTGESSWRVGLAICYDVRFPELFRTMGEVDLLVIPAAFTETTGRAHWELLLRARAVENQCYVLAAAQGGQHPTGRVTHGNSMLVDPWGDVVARMDKGTGVVLGAMERARLTEVRTSLPALRHRKI